MKPYVRYSLAAWVVVLGFVGIYFAVRLPGSRVFEAAIPPGDPMSSLRSITWYDIRATPPSGQYFTELQNTLPAIKGAGFSTLWLVNPWHVFNPQPLATPPAYNDQAFTNLRATLALLRSNNMKAMLGLNYLGQGWAPSGIDACNWIRDPVQYAAFERYATEFLRRIVDYSDIVYVFVFTEGAEPCDLGPYHPPHSTAAHQFASQLRATLGSFPTRLPPSLRSQFKIGYHDYSLVTLDWGQGQYPIATPIPFDFVSMVAYGLESMTDSQIRTEITTRAGRFRSLYPSTPLVIGEFGASSCPPTHSDTSQSRVLAAITDHAINRGYGFNLWGWKPGPPSEECANPNYGGLAVTNQNGSPKPAVAALRSILTPRINSGGVTTTYNPWVVWLRGRNFTRSVRVRLFDTGRQWGSDITPVLAPDYTVMTFQLPSNRPPSNCNLYDTCVIRVRLFDQTTGLLSSEFSLTLPRWSGSITPPPPSPPSPPPAPPPTSPSTPEGPDR